MQPSARCFYAACALTFAACSAAPEPILPVPATSISLPPSSEPSPAATPLPTLTPSVTASASPPEPGPLPSCPPDMVLVAGGASTRTATQEPFEVAPFCLDRFEVTTRQYRACEKDPARSCAPLFGKVEQKATAPGWRLPQGSQCNAGVAGRSEHPANCMTWAEAVHFCESLHKRLPTADEWEVALLGPGGRRSVSAEDANLCNADCAHWARHGITGLMPNTSTVRDGWATTAPVGTFPNDRSPDGALDMVGNVREWTADLACAGEPTCHAPERVVFGDSWFDVPGGGVDLKYVLRRNGGEPAERRRSFVGFRCAR